MQDLNALFRELLPDLTPESGRMLIAHVARTANVSAADPGLPVAEVQRALGISTLVGHTPRSGGVVGAPYIHCLCEQGGTRLTALPRMCIGVLGPGAGGLWGGREGRKAGSTVGLLWHWSSI